MALDWLQRIGPSKGEFLIEKVAMAYTLLTSIAIVVLYGQMDHPMLMLLERLAIVVVTLALVVVYHKYPCKVTAFLRVGFQLALLSYWYPDTFEFNRLLPNLDHLFADAEQAIFNAQPAYWFHRCYPQMWISEPLNMGYVAYFPLIAVITCWYFVKHFDLFEKIGFVLTASFFIYYIIYMVLPVAGPQFYFPAIGEENVLAGIFPAVGDYFNLHPELMPYTEQGQGFFYHLLELSHEAGERPTAAFPSSHVGISTIIMLMGWRSSKKLTLWMLPFYILLCISTVYIQAHYLIDIFAGWISGYLLYVFTSWLFRKAA
ncbi:MAG: phosphatase PAP2 family protein [Bacteroidaceae bacterium]|nr:phosphatase PAP2 family protein [Bacteroidaceae bacterium]